MVGIGVHEGCGVSGVSGGETWVSGIRLATVCQIRNPSILTIIMGMKHHQQIEEEEFFCEYFMAAIS